MYPFLEHDNKHSFKLHRHQQSGKLANAGFEQKTDISHRIFGGLNNRSFLMQVCNLAWSKNVNELVSTHGYSQNQIIVWKYPTMSKVRFLCFLFRFILFLARLWDFETLLFSLTVGNSHGSHVPRSVPCSITRWTGLSLI